LKGRKKPGEPPAFSERQSQGKTHMKVERGRTVGKKGSRKNHFGKGLSGCVEDKEGWGMDCMGKRGKGRGIVVIKGHPVNCKSRGSQAPKGEKKN